MLMEGEGVDVRAMEQSLFVIEPNPAERYLRFPLTDIQQAYMVG
jgi:hypothetical protein